jgi:hypothetical protein
VDIYHQVENRTHELATGRQDLLIPALHRRNTQKVREGVLYLLEPHHFGVDPEVVRLHVVQMPLGLGLQLQRLYHTKFVKGQGQCQPVVVRTVLRIGLVVYLKLRQAKGDFIDLDHQVDLLLLQG